jgi:hypothetical protein
MTRLSARIRFGLLGVVAVLVCQLAPMGPLSRRTGGLLAADDPDPRSIGGGRKDDGPRITVLEFRTRRAFRTDEDFGRYVKQTARVGCRMRAAVDYQSVKKGMMGTYYGTNDGTPPCLVIWDLNLNSGSVLLPNVPPEKAKHAYWVFWHQVEIVSRKY